MHRVTQLFLARPQAARHFWKDRNAVIKSVVRMAGEIQITVIAERNSHASMRG